VRWFFFLLVLSNLALAGWFYWHGETKEHDQALTERAPDRKRLQLLNELPLQSLKSIPLIESASKAPPSLPPSTSTDEATSPEPTTAPEASRPKDQAVSCVRVSHLAKTTDVEMLMHKLAQSNLTVLDSGEELTERQTYWVMIPPYKTANAARDAAALLAKARVRDFLVVRSGEFKNAISLGLFSQKEGADSRLQEIRTLKLDIRQPEILPRTSSVSSHWLIARAGSEAAQETLSKLISTEGLEALPLDCPP